MYNAACGMKFYMEHRLTLTNSIDEQDGYVYNYVSSFKQNTGWMFKVLFDQRQKGYCLPAID
jgi:hypothetical protein